MGCSCKKVGLKCSMACKHCNGINCLNCEQKILSFEDGVDDNIEDNLSESHSEVETSSESDLDDSSLYSLDNEIDRMITNQNESDTDIFSCSLCIITLAIQSINLMILHQVPSVVKFSNKICKLI